MIWYCAIQVWHWKRESCSSFSAWKLFLPWSEKCWLHFPMNVWCLKNNLYSNFFWVMQNSFLFPVRCLQQNFSSEWQVVWWENILILPSDLKQISFELGLKKLNTPFVPWLKPFNLQSKPLKEWSWYLQDSVRLMQIFHCTNCWIWHHNSNLI